MRLPKHCLQQVALGVWGYPNSSQHQQVTQLMHMPCRRARGDNAENPGTGVTVIRACITTSSVYAVRRPMRVMCMTCLQF